MLDKSNRAAFFFFLNRQGQLGCTIGDFVGGIAAESYIDDQEKAGHTPLKLSTNFG